MLKAPSLARDLTWIYSGDPALDAPEHADDEDWQRRLAVARDTGQWAPVLKAGEVPTLFTLRPVPGIVWRAVMDQLQVGERGAGTMTALVARVALVRVDHFLGEDGKPVEVKRVDERPFGQIASTAIINALDAIDPGIVGELAKFVMERQNSIGPKS